MIKRHKKSVIITCLLTLSPLFAGLILWNRLPERIATHFGMDGTPNGWSGKIFAVFGLPMFLLIIQLICVFVTSADPKGKNISDKAYQAILWIVPASSLICGYSIYSHALGLSEYFGIEKGIYLFLGISLLVLGNYLPKSGPNFTIGIKLPWTLTDEDNWRKTHRLAGKLFVLGGIVFMINVFLQWHWLLWGIMIPLILIPCIYSFCLYQKKKRKE